MAEVRTFWRVVWTNNKPRVEPRELTLVPAGTPCGSSWLETPAWGTFHEQRGFCLWGRTEADLAELHGYATTPDGAWDLAIAKADSKMLIARRESREAALKVRRLVAAREAAATGDADAR